ncbi:hypothetical protein [Streptomyces adelaidensis]|uniref:hypothetical protein n=1 Tax=Streptomyces adelaidensis TaxID=2796465 RepID=UPI00190887FE|nr:hypothetical protein [Streptomyces adelaidensis]
MQRRAAARPGATRVSAKQAMAVTSGMAWNEPSGACSAVNAATTSSSTGKPAASLAMIWADRS